MDLPIADDLREAAAKQIFRDHVTMHPAEWAARFAHTVGMSSFAEYRYRDLVLHTWIHELHHILRSSAAVEHARQRYLTPHEYARIRHEEQADF